VYANMVGTVYFDDLTVQKIGTTTSVRGTSSTLPSVYDLSNNYPNPFNPTTNIQFAVPQQGTITLAVYNVLGQRVKTLATGVYPPGHYMVTWDGKDESGRAVASGIYFSRLETGSIALVKKMLMMK
jgi:flagellar hook assembly protein FlgD